MVQRTRTPIICGHIWQSDFIHAILYNRTAYITIQTASVYIGTIPSLHNEYTVVVPSIHLYVHKTIGAIMKFAFVI